MRTIVACLALALCGCMTDEDSARRALDGAGFTEIRFTGYDYFACAKDDFSHTGFTAKGPSGKTVSGVVCCGLMFKACTVRF